MGQKNSRSSSDRPTVTSESATTVDSERFHTAEEAKSADTLGSLYDTNATSAETATSSTLSPLPVLSAPPRASLPPVFPSKPSPRTRFQGLAYRLDNVAAAPSTDLECAFATHLSKPTKKGKDEEVADLMTAFIDAATTALEEREGTASPRGKREESSSTPLLCMDVVTFPSYLLPLSARCVALFSERALPKLRALEGLLLPGQVDFTGPEGQGAGKALGRALSSSYLVESLQRLDLSRCSLTSEVMWAVASQVKAPFPLLRELNLSGNPGLSSTLNGTNGSSEQRDGLAALCSCLRHMRRLTLLDLSSCGIGLAGCRALSKSLPASKASVGVGVLIGFSGSLILSDNPAIGTAAETASPSTGETSLTSDSAATETDAGAAGVSENPTTTSHSAVYYIGQSLRDLPLLLLDLSRCCLNDDAIFELAPFLKKARSIGTLRLRGNALAGDGKGFALLLDCLPSIRGLSFLDLSDNPLLGDDGAIALIAAFTAGRSNLALTFRSLDLSNCSLGEDAAREVVSTIAELPPVPRGQQRVVKLPGNKDIGMRARADLMALSNEALAVMF